LDPIEFLNETLLLNSYENKIEERGDKDSDEEGFTSLEENIEEDNEFFEQLLKHCNDKNFLVKFCTQRKEEYTTFLQNY
jgi:hypothetical protein